MNTTMAWAGSIRSMPAMPEQAPFKVVILSASAPNLVRCLQSVMTHEPELPPSHIIVVDDGARHAAESELPPVRWLSGIRPFVFARNVNLAFSDAAADIILLNDDAQLMTPRGFSLMVEELAHRPEVGVCSAGIRGAVGNLKQIAQGAVQFQFENRALAFVCVFLRKIVYDEVGPLDERFVGYGFEDDDYCARVLRAGMKLGIWSGCVVDHSGDLPSTFRTKSNFRQLFDQNRRLFQQKWAAGSRHGIEPGARGVGSCT